MSSSNIEFPAMKSNVQTPPPAKITEHELSNGIRITSRDVTSNVNLLENY